MELGHLTQAQRPNSAQGWESGAAVYMVGFETWIGKGPYSELLHGHFRLLTDQQPALPSI